MTLNKRLVGVVCGLVCLGCLTGCDNYVAKNFGGTMTVNLEEGERFVQATWKGGNNSLWITTVKNPSVKPQTYTMKECSQFGVLEGKVVIVEK